MNSLKVLIAGICAYLTASAQVPMVRPQVAGRAVRDGQVTVVYPTRQPHQFRNGTFASDWGWRRAFTKFYRFSA
jgi:hypothetical protein